MRARLQVEPLESRDLLSGGLPSVQLPLSTPSGPFQSARVQSIVSTHQVFTGWNTTLPGPGYTVPPTSLAQRWDQVLVGTWYVPPVNMLAYLVGPTAVNPLALADQTIFQITSADNGSFSGSCSVQFGRPTPQGTVTGTPIGFTLEGVVTPQGQIRIQFTPTDPQQAPVTGLGTMEWVNNAWRMTMQMASTSSLRVVHWAYMTRLPPGGTPPAPVVQPSDASQGSDQGSWLLGTRWLLNDTSGVTGAGAGLFEIVGYRKGYFLGRGLGQSTFSVFGSVTPEGKLFLLLISTDGTTVTRTGTLEPNWVFWRMDFRSYEGTPGLGIAWQVGTDKVGPQHNQL